MLVNMKSILSWAEENQCAAGAFNCATLESARAAVAAAEQLDVPVILQHAGAHEEYISQELAGDIMLALARRSRVPVCVHLDHGAEEDCMVRAIRQGFTSVMYDASNKPYEQNIAETRRITQMAHALDMTVEAELGCMPDNLKGQLKDYTPEDFYTNPDQAARFFQETGVDALAISFGTVHGVYKTLPKLSVPVIERVRAATGGLPLVMHGGSGLTDDDYRRVIRAGIRKINYNTYASLAGGRAVLELAHTRPERLFFHDVALCATQKMTEDMLRVLKLFSKKA